MAKVRTLERGGGPGLLFLLVALVVAAVVGARFFGFAPGAEEGPGSGEQARVEPSRMAPGAGTGSSGSSPARLASGRMPVVLIYHSHATEQYSPTEPHTRGGKPGQVVDVGAELAGALEQRGVRPVHIKTVHDHPTYNEAFVNALASLQKALRSEPETVAVLDVHRDGLPEGYPEGYTTAEIDGQKVAKVLLVVGDVANPYASQNLAFAEKLRTRMNDMYPGLSRGIKVQHGAYNGHVHPNSVQVFIGDYKDNTVEEARAAARLLADVVAAVLEEERGAAPGGSGTTR